MNCIKSRKYLSIYAIIIFAVTIIVLMANGSGQTDIKKTNKENVQIPEELEECYLPEEGMVPDAETAIKIAETVWLPIYGSSINDQRPFQAEKLDDSTWLVHGNYGNDYSREGGVTYAKIRKSDAAVLCVIHGE
jgi:hypothetical protein